jgi:pilus assembly protein TadC
MAVLAGLLTGLAVLVLQCRAGPGRLATLPHAVGGSAQAGRAAPRHGAAKASTSDVERGAGTGGAPGPLLRSLLRVPSATWACLVGGAAVALLVAPPVGVALGLGVAVAGPRLLGRLEPRAAREHHARLLADLPLTLDLLAACLSGGAALPAAARQVAAAVDGPCGQRLLGVASALDVGSAPPEAWALLAGDRDPDRDRRQDDPLAPAARALARAADGGAPVAGTVSRLAVEARADARSRGEQAARRVGVLAVAPLGLCFLPAFVLLGIVPVVVGLAGPLLATW